MGEAPERIICKSGVYHDYAQDWLEGEWEEKTPDMAVDPSREVEYVRADLAPSWQPTETAPKDGTEFLSWIEGQDKPYLTVWRDGWFVADVYPHEWTEYLVNPTHWMPHPAPPAEGEE